MERRLSTTRHGERSAQAGCKIEFTHAQSGSLAEIQALTEISDKRDQRDQSPRSTIPSACIAYVRSRTELDPDSTADACWRASLGRDIASASRYSAVACGEGYRRSSPDARQIFRATSLANGDARCHSRAGRTGPLWSGRSRGCSATAAHAAPTGISHWLRVGIEKVQKSIFLYRDHLVICDSHEVDDVLEAFDQIREDRPVSVTDGPVGLKVLDIGDRDAAQLSDALADVVGDDVVTPNHVLEVQGFSSFCPATEPVPWRPLVTELGESAGPGRSRVAVVDTGYLASIAQDSGYGRFSVVDRNSETDDTGD